MAGFLCRPATGQGAFGQPRNRGTLSGRYVRVQKKGLSPKRKPLNLLERETGFEPATSTLARLHSTTELLPRGVKKLIGDSGSSVNRKNGCRRIFLHRAGQSWNGHPCIGRERSGRSFSSGGFLMRQSFPAEEQVTEGLSCSGRPVFTMRQRFMRFGRSFCLPGRPETQIGRAHV